MFPFRFLIKNLAILTFWLIGLFISLHGYTQQGQYSTDRLIIHSLESHIFNNVRQLRVYLPENYDSAAEQTYRVLYLNDGQFLFGDASAKKKEWRIDETIDSLIREKEIEPLIVVGIDHAGSGMRANEYLPWEDEYLFPPMEKPQGENYPAFLKKEVIPFIESHYKVKKGGQNRGLGGSSYGGLITLYTILKDPGTFDFALIESPSLYVNDQEIFELCTQKRVKWPSFIYLGVGTNELGIENCDESNADNQMAVADVKKLAFILENSGKGKNHLKILIEKCAVHSEESWARRFPEAIKVWK
jgi:predicted alpha/beta superfamily hydrolase